MVIRFYRLHLFIILILEKEPVFPFLMSSAKQGNYLVPFLKRLWYDAVLDWVLNPGPPALDASTPPLGYRGGGVEFLNTKSKLVIKKV